MRGGRGGAFVRGTEVRTAMLVAWLTVAAVFVPVFVLDARLNASPSSVFVEIAPAIPIVIAAIPVLSTILLVVAFHSRISTHCAIIAVVAVSTGGVVTQIVVLLCLPIATDTDILAAFLILLPRLFQLLGGPFGLNGSGLRLAWSRNIFRVLSE
jgi:hypothetical protein